MPAALRQSFGAWLRANDLEPLLPVLYTIVSATPWLDAVYNVPLEDAS
jgi:hypothetical protein